MDSELEQFESLGMIALVGLVLVPGVLWVLKSKGVGSKLVRSTVVAGLLLGAVTLESSMDELADEL